VGDLAYPLVSDLKREITTRYNVLTPDGVALRGLFIIDKEVRPPPPPPPHPPAQLGLGLMLRKRCAHVAPAFHDMPPPSLGRGPSFTGQGRTGSRVLSSQHSGRRSQLLSGHSR